MTITTDNKTFIFCNNCGNKGHNFHNCKFPITSIGVIVYRYNNEIKDFEYLMIRRRNTLGFVDFIRGKYNIYNKGYLKNIINEMTNKEKELLKEKDFEGLWNYIWDNTITLKYKNEEKISKDKYTILKQGINTTKEFYNLESLIEESTTKWNEEEWGFPKGRRNFQEKDIYTALREFNEETGIDTSEIKIIKNIIPYEEIFTGSNYKSYKHKYYIAKIINNDISLDKYQKSEVGKIEWKSFHNSIKSIRPYNKEKMVLLDKIHKTLKYYTREIEI
jgi:8-oxo-dGTP pyrophosphatase MutT (NUDIX family)